MLFLNVDLRMGSSKQRGQLGSAGMLMIICRLSNSTVRVLSIGLRTSSVTVERAGNREQFSLGTATPTTFALEGSLQNCRTPKNTQAIAAHHGT
jgi:hypothetical protein